MSQDKDDLHHEESQGVKAKEILNDDTFKTAVETLKETYLEEMIKTGIAEDEARKYLWMSYHTLGKVVANLEEVMTTGELAREQIKNIEKYS